MPGMLAILIPTKDYAVAPLVAALDAQAQRLAQPLELHLLEDGSAPGMAEANAQALADCRALRTHQHHHTTPKGAGPARNALASASQKPWLLFLDADVLPERDDFLQRYLAHLATLPPASPAVLCGGLSYAPTPPADPQLHLRWAYGQAREAVPANLRQHQPHRHLFSANLLVHRSVFAHARFPVDLPSYGHDDTLFGHLLAQAKVPAHHLPNPARHLGLMPAQAFLQKAEQALDNLVYLMQHPTYGPAMAHPEPPKIWAAAQRVRQLPGLAAALRLAEPALRRHLMGSRPNLQMFDAYRLSRLLRRLA